MTEFKGTKGKWEINRGRTIHGIHSGMSQIAIVEGIFINANALLISKAPEMLEMLGYILEYQGSGFVLNHDLSKEIEQLIKEATEL